MIFISYKEMRIWREAHELTLAIYKATKDFPREELYGITSQLRRASASVSANIVEGSGRSSDKEFRRFLYIARASAMEAAYFCVLSRDLAYFDELYANQIISRFEGLSAGIYMLMQKLKTE